MMKLTLKTILFLCFLISFPAFLLQMVRVHVLNLQISTSKSKNLCSEKAANDINSSIQYLKKLYSSCNCHIEVKYPYSNLDKVKVYPSENHFIYFSPRKNHNSKKPLCPAESPLLRGHITVNISTVPDDKKILKINGKYQNWPLTFEEIAASYPNLVLGGHYPGPQRCRCRSLNAIIIPYRDREVHLRYFLYYLHDLLQRQQLCYVVIVSEQADNKIFNKGQLMNTAFEYARKVAQFDCYIFHDVDTIAEDDRILYACREHQVTHIAPFIDKFRYVLMKVLTVGAAVGFTEKQFLSVNGYSNEYAGWGGEDDDMKARMVKKRLVLWRSKRKYTRFKMIRHERDPGNTINVHRYLRLRQSKRRIKIDGLSTLDTEIEDVIMYVTHIRLKVISYKTGMQLHLEKFKENKRWLPSNTTIPSYLIPNGTGIAIQMPGTVIINKKKKKT